MDWERMRGQLETVLQKAVRIDRLTNEQWAKAAAAEGLSPKACRSAAIGEETAFILEPGGGNVQAMIVSGEPLRVAERKLVELILEGARQQDKSRPGPPASEEERKVRLVKEWLSHVLEAGEANAEMPDALALQLGFRQTKIPFLLYGDYSDSRTVQYHELKRLMESFFGADVMVIPLLEKEWLILGPESLLDDSGEEREPRDDTEQLQDALASICSGLHEMLSNEWVGECHLSIHYPIKPAKELIRAVMTLREAIALGRTFDVVHNIHFPWKLQLEKLLSVVPDSERQPFIDRVLRGAEHVLDAETLGTLEHFFLLDCNVSETAKKLYIHRNTLLYRLDKFRGETGLDVRNFSDAVLVKVALLLYKVTKRK